MIQEFQTADACRHVHFRDAADRHPMTNFAALGQVQQKAASSLDESETQGYPPELLVCEEQSGSLLGWGLYFRRHRRHEALEGA